MSRYGKRAGGGLALRSAMSCIYLFLYIYALISGLYHGLAYGIYNYTYICNDRNPWYSPIMVKVNDGVCIYIYRHDICLSVIWIAL